jgi:hypothetical protein
VAELEDIKRLLERAEPTFLAQHVVTDSSKFEQLAVWLSLYYCLVILVYYELRVLLRCRAFSRPFDKLL